MYFSTTVLYLSIRLLLVASVKWTSLSYVRLDGCLHTAVKNTVTHDWQAQHRIRWLRTSIMMRRMIMSSRRVWCLSLRWSRRSSTSPTHWWSFSFITCLADNQTRFYYCNLINLLLPVQVPTAVLSKRSCRFSLTVYALPSWVASLQIIYRIHAFFRCPQRFWIHQLYY